MGRRAEWVERAESVQMASAAGGCPQGGGSREQIQPSRIRGRARKRGGGDPGELLHHLPEIGGVGGEDGGGGPAGSPSAFLRVLDYVPLTVGLYY